MLPLQENHAQSALPVRHYQLAKHGHINMAVAGMEEPGAMTLLMLVGLMESLAMNIMAPVT